MTLNENSPMWQKELALYRGIKSTFILTGNIYDRYMYYGDSECKEAYPFDLNGIIERVFHGGDEDGVRYDCYYCDVLNGIIDNSGELTGEKSRFVKTCERYNNISAGNAVGGETTRTENEMDNGADPVRLAALAKSMLTVDIGGEGVKSNPIAVTFNCVSRFSSKSVAFYTNLQYASDNARFCNSEGHGRLRNTLILVADKLSDVPEWFYVGNSHVKIIEIGIPERSDRAACISSYSGLFLKNLSSKPEELLRMQDKLIDATDGLRLLEIIESLTGLFRKATEKTTSPLEIVRLYKYGVKGDRWDQIRRKLYQIYNYSDPKLRERPSVSSEDGIIRELAKYVKGQEPALKSARDVLVRSVTGLSGLQHSSDNKPKGVLFLAGPTGTGKTELVKAITRLLFEDERAMIRFDMSEYQEEHADQKLFGAPPGYVGYEQGGQLTNAVRIHPFSILLFDEIEKAHPTIMDKFLQILEDGRMTDGQGNTVSFSESIIIFTSNIGISEVQKYDVTHDDGRVTHEEKLAYLVELGSDHNTLFDAVWTAANSKLKPELINRIGKNNFIVFDFINPEVAKDILLAQLQKVNAAVEKRYGIVVTDLPASQEFLLRKCLEDDIRKMGGRGVGTVVESLYLNGLSDYIFKNNIYSDNQIVVDYSAGDMSLTFRQG